MRPRPRSVGGREPEGAFTVVEVVVAALVISIVLAAVVTVTSGAGRAQQRSKVRQQMAETADGALDQLRLDRAWADDLDEQTCRDGCTVSLSPDVVRRLTEGRHGLRFQLAILAWPVDSDSDGVGVDDADRIVPDYVRIEVTVSMSPAQQTLFGTQRPHRTVSTVDMQGHRAGTGTLVVHTCEASNQVDERATIRQCDTPADTRLIEQPAPCRANPSLTFAALLADRRAFALGCNASLDEAIVAAPALARMRIVPVTNLGFALVLDDGDGTATRRVHGDAEVDPTRGTYTFTGLPAGTWQLRDIQPGPDREIWASKAIPSTRSVTVPPGRQARALLVQRPVQRRGRYRATFTRTTYRYRTTYPTATAFGGQATVLGATVSSSTTFSYRLVVGPARSTQSGTAWDGVVAIEPKPAGRSIDDVTQVPAQQRIPVRWAASGGTSSVEFTRLPSGLHATPEFVPCVGSSSCGSELERSTTCVAGSPTQVPTQAGGCMQEGAWVTPAGAPGSTTTFHSDRGECYLDGSLVSGGAPRGSGACGAAVQVGVRVLLHAEATTTCIPHTNDNTCSGGGTVSGDGPCITGPSVSVTKVTTRTVDGEQVSTTRSGGWTPSQTCG